MTPMPLARGRLVIVGGGYLGGRLVQALAGEGQDLLVLGRRAASLPPAPGVAFAPLQLPQAKGLEELLEGACGIVNLVACDEATAHADPAAALAVTAGGAARLVAAARAVGVSRFLQVSSVQVFGPPRGLVLESQAPAPRGAYAIAHRAAEDFVLAAGAEGLDVTLLRLANLVGAPASPAIARWELLGNDLCRQAVACGRLRLRSDGSPRRSFLAIEQAVAGLRHLLFLPPAAREHALYTLAGATWSVGALAESVARLAGGLAIERGAPAPPAPDFRFAVGRIAASGFRPEESLDAALADCLAFCRRELLCEPRS